MERDGFIKDLDLGEIQKMAEKMDSGYVDGTMLISMDYEAWGKRLLSPGQPYLLNEGRVMRILSGEGTAFINLEHHRLEPGMCLVVPPHSVFEIERLMGDFQLQVFSFSEGQEEEQRDRVLAVRPDKDLWRLAGMYFDLMREESQRKPVSRPALLHLQSALLAHLKEFGGQEGERPRQQDHERLRIFRRFTELIGAYGAREHEMGFYAEQIGLSPNYLGAVVKAASGLTGAELIQRSLVIRAKLMLRYSDRTVGEISEELNFSAPSAFSKFFRRRTGRTPLGYRKGEEKG